MRLLAAVILTLAAESGGEAPKPAASAVKPDSPDEKPAAVERAEKSPAAKPAEAKPIAAGGGFDTPPSQETHT